MLRRARIDAPGVLHHVIGRGIEQRDIFIDDIDRRNFLDRLELLAMADAFRVAAWSLLRNHFHLLITTGDLPLSVSMHRLLTGYVVAFNKRHRRHGYLFQNRFKSIVCQQEPYFRELVRYIHLNPLRAGDVADLYALEHHPFAGHGAILGRTERPWQDVNQVLRCFGPQSPQDGYREFVAAGVGMGRRPELVGGGLVRSAGGWSAVKALRRRGVKIEHDERILGDPQFVAETVQRADQRLRKSLRLGVARPEIEGVCRRVCEKYGVSFAELCSGSRRQPVAAARAVLSWVAVRELGYSGAEVARFLGVTNSCVTRTVASTRAENLGDVMGLVPAGPAGLS